MLGILDWYTVSTAVFTLVCLCAHGASYLALKAEGEVYRRAKALTKWLWPGTVFLLLVVSLETFYVRPALFSGMAGRPVGMGRTRAGCGRFGGHRHRPAIRRRSADVLGRMRLHRRNAGQRGREPVSGDPLFDGVPGVFDHGVQRLVGREQSAGSHLLVAGGVCVELRLLRVRREALPRPRTQPTRTGTIHNRGMPLTDKVVLITGANGGLGMAVTKAFLEAGARVAGVAKKIQNFRLSRIPTSSLTPRNSGAARPRAPWLRR